MDEGAGMSHMTRKLTPLIIRTTKKTNIITVNRIINAMQVTGWGYNPAINSFRVSRHSVWIPLIYDSTRHNA